MGWNRQTITDWMAMAGAVSALVTQRSGTRLRIKDIKRLLKRFLRSREFNIFQHLGLGPEGEEVQPWLAVSKTFT